MRIGYFADGPWSHKAIRKLIEDDTLKIVFVCARFDKQDQTLKVISENENIPFLTHPKINSDEFLKILDRFECDILISMSFNQIFKKKIISHPPKGIINCHAGKLPFYRGRNVLNWVLINGEPEFGITVHYVDDGIDTGDIILQQVYPISDSDNYSTLLSRAYQGCADLLYKAIKQIQDGSNERISQESINPLGFYCSGREVGDENLDWNQTSMEIFNFVRAICKPGPQARTFINGATVLINKVIYLPEASHYKGISGAVLSIRKDELIVKTNDSFIKVVEWSSDVKIKVGDRFK